VPLKGNLMSVKIRAKNGKLILDIHYGNAKRTRPSTGLKDTEKNRELLSDNVIPSIELDIAKGTYVPKAERVAIVQTVKDYGELSFKRHKNDRRVHVQASYKNHFKNHIVPAFGNRMIASITPMNLLDWQNKKLETYAATTVRKYRSILYTIFEDAVIEGLIDKNPFERVARPVLLEKYSEDDDLDEEEKNVDPFSLDEVQEILSKTDGYKQNYIAIMAFSGVRPGELVALRWSDVDWESETFKVVRTRIRGEFGPTKTKSSKRVVEMIPNVKEYFLKQYKLTGGNLFDMVFISSSDKPFYSHDTIAVQFKKLLREGDTRYLYQLRHTFASLMICHGEEITWVSQMLGHKSSDITLKVYAKAYKVLKDKNKRKKRAPFLNNWHKSGTVNNQMYDKLQEIGENR
jgi:integrase